MRVVLLLLVVSLAAASSELVERLAAERQDDLYYDTRHLPKTVADIIGEAPAIRELQAAFAESADPIVQFNLVLIFDKLVAGNSDDEKYLRQAKPFLLKCTTHPNPWVRTESIWSLGSHYPINEKMFDTLLHDPSDFVFYESVSAYAHTQKKVICDPELVARLDRVRQAFADRTAAANAEMEAYVSQLKRPPAAVGSVPAPPNP
jgi:hypothetical protein